MKIPQNADLSEYVGKMYKRPSWLNGTECYTIIKSLISHTHFSYITIDFSSTKHHVAIFEEVRMIEEFRSIMNQVDSEIYNIDAREVIRRVGERATALSSFIIP